MHVSDQVVFLMTVNHAWTAARVRDVRAAGFGLRTILLCPMPKEFPQSGFQLGAVHYARDWSGPVTLGWLDAPPGALREHGRKGRKRGIKLT